MKIMHVADLHLGCRQYGFAEREEDFYRALHEVGQIAIDKHVDVVILAGDIFDSPKPPAKAVLEMSTFVRKMQVLDKVVVGIEGNHDKTQDNYWLRVCRIEPLEDRQVAQIQMKTLETVKIAGLNFDRSENILSRLDEMSDQGMKAEVVALHLGLAEMGAGFSPDLSVHQLAPKLKAIGCKYCALGHIHVPMEQQVDRIWFAQPGSLELKSIDEPQDKGVEIFEIVDGRIVSMERVPYATRKVRFEDVRTDDDLAKFTAGYAEEVKDSLVVAYVSAAVNDGVSRIGEWARGNGVMCRVVPVGGDEEAGKEYDRKDSMNLLKDAVEAFFDEGSEQYKLVMDILQTGDPRLVMERYMNNED